MTYEIFDLMSILTATVYKYGNYSFKKSSVMANTTNNEKENYSTITPTMTVLLSAQVNVGEVFSPFYYSESAFA